MKKKEKEKEFFIEKEKSARSEHYHLLIIDILDGSKTRIIRENVGKCQSNAVVSVPRNIEVREMDLYRDSKSIRLEGKVHKNGKTEFLPSLSLRRSHPEFAHAKEVWEQTKLNGEVSLFCMGLEKMAFN